MRVTLTQETIWEISDEIFFKDNEDSWDELVSEFAEMDDYPDDYDKRDFISQILWDNVPYFEQWDGKEVWDDARIEVEL